MQKEYSNIRVLLSVALVILFLILGGESSKSREIQLNFLPITLFLVGTILFTLNRKWADYISFSIMTFVFVGSITIIVDNCRIVPKICEKDYLNWQLENNKLEIAFLIISGLVLTYLISNFFKVKNISK